MLNTYAFAYCAMEKARALSQRECGVYTVHYEFVIDKFVVVKGMVYEDSDHLTAIYISGERTYYKELPE